jgi:hypothetical protein
VLCFLSLIGFGGSGIELDVRYVAALALGSRLVRCRDRVIKIRGVIFLNEHYMILLIREIVFV